MRDLCLYNKVNQLNQLNEAALRLLREAEYFNFVLTLLITFCSANYTPYIKEWSDNKQDKMYSSISLTTMQLPCFTVLRGPLPRTLNIQELLTPIALAHWIMGDGSKQN